jgi:hypothetical protein
MMQRSHRCRSRNRHHTEENASISAGDTVSIVVSERDHPGQTVRADECLGDRAGPRSHASHTPEKRPGISVEWSQINLAGPYPPTINFFTGYCTTCSGVGNDAVQNGGVGTYVATPENSTILLMGVGLVGLVLLARRRSNSHFVA